jgi:hypothetical protein
VKNLKLLLPQSLHSSYGRNDFIMPQFSPDILLAGIPVRNVTYSCEHSDLHNSSSTSCSFFQTKKDPSPMSETLIRKKKLFIMKLNTQSGGPI